MTNNTTLAFAEGDAVLALALIFCILFLMVGFKEKLFWFVAGPIWIISGAAVFMEYDQWFMIVSVGVGMVLILWGAYDVYK